jgi:leader peptidase (prepilin peptidase)/N-methyltransferase
MDLIYLGFLVFVVGLLFGSFLSSFTYRYPKDISVAKGRSKCPKCNKVILWYHNIPLFSYLFLGGKCFSCKGKISVRYPLIEFITALAFLFVYKASFECFSSSSPICFLKQSSGFYFYPLIFLLTLILLSIFIIDFEHKLIPDNLVFFGIGLVFLTFLLQDFDGLVVSFLSGLIVSSFLLFLNLVTKGKGMGLGDVKLAILGGMMLIDMRMALVWMFLSFLTGALVGIILILGKKAKFGRHIAFGPFMIFSLFLVLGFGDKLIEFYTQFFK